MSIRSPADPRISPVMLAHSRLVEFLKYNPPPILPGPMVADKRDATARAHYLNGLYSRVDAVAVAVIRDLKSHYSHTWSPEDVLANLPVWRDDIVGAVEHSADEVE